MREGKDPQREPVVAVCGTEARVYGPQENPESRTPRRPLWRVVEFRTHGAALHYAQTYEDGAGGKS